MLRECCTACAWVLLWGVHLLVVTGAIVFGGDVASYSVAGQTVIVLLLLLYMPLSAALTLLVACYCCRSSSPGDEGQTVGGEYR